MRALTRPAVVIGVGVLKKRHACVIQTNSYIVVVGQPLAARNCEASNRACCFPRTPPTIVLSPGRRYFSAVHGTRPPTRAIKITNSGDQPMVIPSGGITMSGGAIHEFEIAYSPDLPLTIQPGQTRSISIEFKPPAAASGIKTTTLHIASNDPTTPMRNVKIRGLITRGEGGTLEPSLQQILDLYQIDDNVGETNPDQTLFTVPPAMPNDEVEAQLLTAANTSQPVTVSLLGVFDNAKTPATAFGFYSPGDSADATQLFTVPLSTDSQTVNPGISGPTTFNPSGTFGIYTLFPAFSTRKSFSEDAAQLPGNPTSGNQKKIRFYPRTRIPTAPWCQILYVFATEDYNVTYDFNDVVGVISNVTPVAVSTTPPPGGGSTGSSTGNVTAIPNLQVQNQAALPSNDRMVFNRITHPDTVRANVTDDEDSLKLTNQGSSPITLDSISSLDDTDFTIVNGGGSDITLNPGQSQTVIVQFNGTAAGTDSILKTFQSNLLIKAGAKTDTVVLAGLWQDYSEQTPADPHHVYDEASLSTIVNTIFGYTTDVANPDQTRTDGLLVKLGNHGDRTAVGDEVYSNYWQAAGGGRARFRCACWRRFIGRIISIRSPAHRKPPLRSLGIFIREIRLPRPSSSSTTRMKAKYTALAACQFWNSLPHNLRKASFTPSSGKAFGFKVDSEWSDDSLNTPDFDSTTGDAYPEPTGHSFRFYPLIDENGNVVPNTYIMAMDYTGLSYSNYDYQDDIYIVSNIKPATTTSSLTSAQEAAASAPPAPSKSLASQMDMTDQGSVLD